jgi:ankyrin repeat protein
MTLAFWSEQMMAISRVLSFCLIFAAFQTGWAEAREARQGQQNLSAPLIEAARKGDLNAVKRLARKGINVNMRDESGYTPLHVTQSKAVAELLIARGADIEARDIDFQMTPLFNASPQVARLLIAKGADVNARAKSGLTPLHWAIYWDMSERIQLLIASGAQVDARDEHQRTPLHLAANWGKATLVTMLLARGADVDARDESGWTPLHWAAMEGTPEAVRLLIEKGADRNAVTAAGTGMFPTGSTPLDIAGKISHADMAAFLQSIGCSRAQPK